MKLSRHFMTFRALNEIVQAFSSLLPANTSGDFVVIVVTSSHAERGTVKATFCGL